MNAYRSSPIGSESLASPRVPRRVYVGIAATIALIAAGAAWFGFAFGGWALLFACPNLLLLLVGLIVQIRRNADPRSIAKYRARTEQLADAWLLSGDPKAQRRALRGTYFRV